jgi:hypothetical protein
MGVHVGRSATQQVWHTEQGGLPEAVVVSQGCVATAAKLQTQLSGVEFGDVHA